MSLKDLRVNQTEIIKIGTFRRQENMMLKIFGFSDFYQIFYQYPILLFITIINQVPVLNGGEGETILLKDLVYNFVYDTGPIHAIDNMEETNKNCHA